MMEKYLVLNYRRIGKNELKIEAIYFPTRPKIQHWINIYESSLINHQDFLPLVDPSLKIKETHLKKLNHRIDRVYEKAKKPKILIKENTDTYPL